MKTARYSDSLEVGELRFDISFTGSNEVGVSNPTSTDACLRCRDFNSRPLWERSLGDVPMPGGAWNGFKLLVELKGRIFVAFANKLAEIDSATGHSKWETATGNTVVHFLLAGEDKIIVQNAYYKFHHPNGGNLSAYDATGREVWRAVIDGDKFANLPRLDSAGMLHASTWGGFAYVIAAGDGKILNRQFTK
jgi:outer membrane protein assembly factor BamB